MSVNFPLVRAPLASLMPSSLESLEFVQMLDDAKALAVPEKPAMKIAITPIVNKVTVKVEINFFIIFSSNSLKMVTNSWPIPFKRYKVRSLFALTCGSAYGFISFKPPFLCVSLFMTVCAKHSMKGLYSVLLLLLPSFESGMVSGCRLFTLTQWPKS